MLLYDYYRSSASYRVRIALNVKGITWERCDVMLLKDAQRSAEHLARNPQGLVPALAIGDQVLTQSLAIIEWLDSRFPQPRLIPEDRDARAAVMARALVIGADIHPLNNLRVMRRLAHELEISQEERDAWSRHWMAEGFDALEAMAGEGPFLGGAMPDLADVFLVPQLYNARRLNMRFARWPKLAAADAAAGRLYAFRTAHPDRFAPKEG
ncbi:MAG: maleylacetoacetate isomerase [Sphingomonas sp.]